MSNLSLAFASALPIEVKSSIPTYVLTFLGCSGFVALSLWGVPRHQLQDVMVMVSCVLFFGLGALASVWAILDRTPRVLLDHRGVTVRGWKSCPVAWADIERVWKLEQRVGALYAQVKVSYVCVAIKHSGQWRENQGGMRKKFASYYHSHGWGDMYFPTKGTSFDADELVAAIQSHIGGARLSAPTSLLSGAKA